MFDDIIREIKRLTEKQHTFSIPIELDEEGYLDRECPGEECLFKFKVYGEDWDKIHAAGPCRCPMCGSEHSSENFRTTEQDEEAERIVMEQASGMLGQALDRGARAANRKWPKDSILQMSLQVQGSKMIPPIVAIKAREEFQLKITCDKCSCRFAVIGSAFFCPTCGHSAAVRVFEDALKKIEAKVTHLEAVREAIPDKDEAELVCRSLLETGLSDGVVALQRVFEQLYSQQPGAVLPLKRNAFQRLKDGSNLWKNLNGKGYEDFLTTSELGRLNVLFQRRHLLQHPDGFITQEYIDNTADMTYKVGQRVVIKKQDVLDMVGIIRKLVDSCRAELGL
ncbi:MAG TPA: hypothetical protein VGB30_00195 [bacterium]